jgi:hypothetical protein
VVFCSPFIYLCGLRLRLLPARACLLQPTKLLCYTTPKHTFMMDLVQTFVQQLFYYEFHPGATSLNHLRQAEICSLYPPPASAFSCEADTYALHVTTENRHLLAGRSKDSHWSVPLPSLKMVLHRLTSVVERLATFLALLMMILLQ